MGLWPFWMSSPPPAATVRLSRVCRRVSGAVAVSSASADTCPASSTVVTSSVTANVTLPWGGHGVMCW